MTLKKNIFIIGPYAAGKSSVGFHLARLCKLPFFDSDREVERRSGVDIDWMFTIEGEAGFRDREQLVIDDLTQKQGVVLATGGGTVVIPACREMLKERGLVVYIQVPFECQAERIKRFPAKRPMLQTEDPKHKLFELNEQRQQLYSELADLSYMNDQKNPFSLARTIHADIKALGDS